MRRKGTKGIESPPPRTVHNRRGVDFGQVHEARVRLLHHARGTLANGVEPWPGTAQCGQQRMPQRVTTHPAVGLRVERLVGGIFVPGDSLFAQIGNECAFRSGQQRPPQIETNRATVIRRKARVARHTGLRF